jgi:hypothetical protein
MKNLITQKTHSAIAKCPKRSILLGFGIYKKDGMNLKKKKTLEWENSNSLQSIPQKLHEYTSAKFDKRK